MDEGEKRALAEALGRLDPETLDKVDRQARQTLSDLEDLNTAFPATQDFLRSKGLTHVRQLDKQGTQELREYLEGVLKGLCKAKA